MGEDGEAGGVRLHVNQALYKFSVCLLKELNRRTPATRRELLEKTSSAWAAGRKRADALQTGWVCSGGLALRLHLPERDGFFFSLFQTATPEVDRPSAGAGKRKASQRGVKSPSYNDASCLRFLAR